MFEFLFKYSRTVFNQGNFVFLNSWPVWMLWAGIAAAATGLGFWMWRKGGASSPIRSVLVWLLQSVLAALLLFMSSIGGTGTVSHRSSMATQMPLSQ